MDPANVTAALVNVFAIALADVYDDDQIDMLGVMFSQLGDTLATISMMRSKQAAKKASTSSDSK